MYKRLLFLVAKMASRFKTVTAEEVTNLKEAEENLNTRKSTINWVRVFEKWCDENSLEKNLHAQQAMMDNLSAAMFLGSSKGFLTLRIFS